MASFAMKHPMNLNMELTDYDPAEKELLLEYMKAVEPNSAGGYVFDCILNTETRIEDVGYEADEYMWSAQDIYHIEHYNAAVTEEFMKHALHAV